MATRTVAKPAAGRSKGQGAADPTKQADRHAQLGTLLLRADLAPDPLERMLAVARIVLRVLADVMRPGSSFQEEPGVLLGQHYLSKRQIGERHRGDEVQVFLQEICSHEPLTFTSHAKYTGDGPPTQLILTSALEAAAAASSGRQGAMLAPAPVTELAQMQLIVRPACSVKQRGGRLLAGGGAVYVECQLQGGGTVTLGRHAETYTFTLPALLLGDPLAESCPNELEGTALIACEASGLSCELCFKPWRTSPCPHYVKGYICRASGEGSQQRIVRVLGSWSGEVAVEGLEWEGQGVLFDGSQAGILPSISLAHPGPRATARLWSAVLEDLICLDEKAAAQAGKAGLELVAALPGHLRDALGFKPEAKGSNLAAALKQEEVGTEQQQPLPLPPCILQHRSKYGPPTYQLQYRMGTVGSRFGL